MRRVWRWLPGWVLAVVVTGALAALSRAPQAAGHGDEGLLRLSWSGQPERIEVCHDLSPEELRNLPRHMRQQAICEGRSAEYRLRVAVDGAMLADERVTGGGLRSDRPIYLYREFPMVAGSRALAVHFDFADEAHGNGRANSTAHRLDALPRMLALDTTITLAPRTVVLVTYDAERQALTIESGRSRP